jgi:predicted MPP superfamily phosphohydrolase
VAGHTHCGQVALPGTPHWSYLGLTEEEALVADGWAPQGYGEPGNAMFVTCGIGFSVVPVRINAPPQVVVFDLTAG